jgi:malonate-semialdehyde dehydrogenase (acetylating)/methylmalonate-semialdehyde dehydrogenase
VAAVADRIAAITVGPGSDDRAQMGPLISARHRDRIAALAAEGVADGAELVVDGRGLIIPGYEGGALHRPMPA